MAQGVHTVHRGYCGGAGGSVALCAPCRTVCTPRSTWLENLQSPTTQKLDSATLHDQALHYSILHQLSHWVHLFAMYTDP